MVYLRNRLTSPSGRFLCRRDTVALRSVRGSYGKNCRHSGMSSQQIVVSLSGRSLDNTSVTSPRKRSHLSVRTLTGLTLIKGLRAKSARHPDRMARRNVGDSCGCAMGARFLGIALLVASTWYAWHWNSSMLSIWVVVLRVLGWSLLSSIGGKMVGILAFRFHQRKSSA
jgi:hypothetical protein